MNKFEFNHKARNWDTYRAFHWHNGPFVEFETGEVGVNFIPRSPSNRTTSSKYGIQLTATRDYHCPTMYFDKDRTEKVPQAWFNQDGQQYLAVDLEQGVAIALTNYRYGRNKDTLQFLPSHLRSMHAVWMGPERMPLPLAQITVSRPDKSIKADLREKLSEVRAAVSAAARIRNLPTMWTDDKWTADPAWVDWTVEDICAYVCTSENVMQYVATNGFSYPRAESKHDFLYI